MKIAIIGSGNIANTHAQELTGMGRKIALVIGIVPEQTEEFQKKWNIEEASTDFTGRLNGILPRYMCVPRRRYTIRWLRI